MRMPAYRKPDSKDGYVTTKGDGGKDKRGTVPLDTKKIAREITPRGSSNAAHSPKDNLEKGRNNP
jgi:hypothetical protein